MTFKSGGGGRQVVVAGGKLWKFSVITLRKPCNAKKIHSDTSEQFTE